MGIMPVSKISAAMVPAPVLLWPIRAGVLKETLPEDGAFHPLSPFPKVEANLASLGAISPLSLDVPRDSPLGSQGPFTGWPGRSCLPNKMPVGHADGAFCRCLREAVRHLPSTSLCAGTHRMAIEHPRSWSRSPAAIIPLARVWPGPGLSVAALLMAAYSIARYPLQAPAAHLSRRWATSLVLLPSTVQVTSHANACPKKKRRGRRPKGGGRRPHLYAIGRMLQRPPHLLARLRRSRRLEPIGRDGGEGGARLRVERGRRDGRVNSLDAVYSILSPPLLPAGGLGGRG